MSDKKLMRENAQKIVRGLELAYERMIKFKRYKGTPLVVSENGKVVKIDPHKAPPKVKYKYE